MIKEKAFLLADKLEGRGYRQARGRLRTGPREFCCLGVACQISKKVECTVSGGSYCYDYERYSLPETVMEYFGFHNSQGSRRDNQDIEIDGKKYICLANANDGIIYGKSDRKKSDQVSFRKIAKYIRENWQAL